MAEFWKVCRDKRGICCCYCGNCERRRLFGQTDYGGDSQEIRSTNGHRHVYRGNGKGSRRRSSHEGDYYDSCEDLIKVVSNIAQDALEGRKMLYEWEDGVRFRAACAAGGSVMGAIGSKMNQALTRKSTWWLKFKTRRKFKPAAILVESAGVEIINAAADRSVEAFQKREGVVNVSQKHIGADFSSATVSSGEFWYRRNKAGRQRCARSRPSATSNKGGEGGGNEGTQSQVAQEIVEDMMGEALCTPKRYRRSNLRQPHRVDT
ncbi:hypothetical protein HDV00_007153 [Rhizophlyctis rosea]|nr:hypothetical protein HDV00_007153 [Rhizophlyctis rosea]